MMITIHPFGSHLPALMGCVASTRGRVLELGSGVFSTPVLHAACNGRELVTAESDAEWMQRFLYLEGTNHRFELVPNWRAFRRLDEEWDVAFVDQSPGHERAPSIERLRTHTWLIVVHDTNQVEHYKLEPLLSSFVHRQDFLELGVPVRTTVVSDREPIPFSIPPVTARHTRVALSGAAIRLAPTGSAWQGHSIDWPGPIGHFFLTGELTIDTATDDLVVHVMFFGAGSQPLFWMNLVPGTIRRGTGSFCVAAEAAATVPAELSGEPHPRWSSVRGLTVRAKAQSASLSVGELSLLALPPVGAP